MVWWLVTRIHPVSWESSLMSPYLSEGRPQRETEATLSTPQLVANLASWAWALGLCRTLNCGPRPPSNPVFPNHFRSLPPGAQAGMWGQ